MDAILNNPFRILGLDPTLDEGIISERVSEIMMNLSNGNKVTYPLDEFYDRILVDPYNTLYYNNLSINKGEPIPPRNIETVKTAYEKLQDPIKRKYYALFAFEFDKTLNGLDAADIIENLESELQLEEKRINRFSHTFSADFLNHFSEIENTNYTIEKDYNSLKIKNLIENGTFLKPNLGFVISQERNFSLEFDCKWIEGIDNSCFSIYWGKDPSKNSYYSFGVSGNGYFYLSNNEDGRQIDTDQEFIGWKKSDAINEYAENHIEVRKNNNSIEFYINSNLVQKTNSYRKFYGDEIGLIVFGKQTVVFNDFKINYFITDIDYATNISITKENLDKIRNLALYYFTSVFTNILKRKTHIESNIDLVPNNDSIPNQLLSLDKALILFGKYFQKEALLNLIYINIINNYTTEYNSISLYFIKDLVEGLKIFRESENWERYENSIYILESFSPEFVENLFLFVKNHLLLLPNIKNDEKYPFDIELFKKTKTNKSHFLGTLNNPFRVLALNHTASEKEIAKRISDLLIFAGMGKSPKYATDLFFGEVDRTQENIKDASKCLDNQDKKIYYSLLWFIEENEADNEFLKDIREMNNPERSSVYLEYLLAHSISFIFRKEKYDKTLNYINVINKISGRIMENASSVLRNYIDHKYIHEGIRFCLYDDITSLLPASNYSWYSNKQLILHSTEGKGVWLLKNLYFDKKVNYEIEIDCEWLEGEDDNKIYTIVFCKDLANSFYSFGLSADGSVYFDAMVEGKTQNLYGWHSSDKINIRAKNNLKVSYSYENNNFDIEINGSCPDRTLNFGINGLEKILLGNYIGVSVVGRQKIAFSNFKITYTNHISRKTTASKIKSSNFTSAINLVTLNLCHCSFVEKQFYYHTTETISLFGQIVNSSFLLEFASKVVGNHSNIDTSVIERYFVDDIYNFIKPQLDKDERVEANEFIEAFHSFSDTSQNYVVHKFIGRPILAIEDSIIKTKDFLKNTPLQGVILGYNLFNTTNENLISVRKILSYTNYQYRLLANNLADTLLDCGIIYFNALQKNRIVLLSEGNQILELINHANTIAIGGEVRKRVNENIDFFEKWVSDAQRKEQEKFKQEQEKQNQENERLRIEHEAFRQGQNWQNQEREKQTKEQEAKNLKNNANQNQPKNKLKVKSGLGKKVFLTLFQFVYKYFILIVIAGFILYSIIHTSSIEPSKWKGNTLVNGASPYDSYFGEGIYDYNSKCWITFKNGNSTDAIACLVNYYTGTTIRNEYIRAGTDYTMLNLPAGIYKVKVFYGKDWNPEKTLNQGLIKGAFDTGFSFSISDNSKDLINVNTTETNEGVRYTTGKITLYTVSNGNMNRRNINSDEFFK